MLWLLAVQLLHDASCHGQDTLALMRVRTYVRGVPAWLFCPAFWAAYAPALSCNGPLAENICPVTALWEPNHQMTSRAIALHRPLQLMSSRSHGQATTGARQLSSNGS